MPALSGPVLVPGAGAVEPVAEEVGRQSVEALGLLSVPNMTKPSIATTTAMTPPVALRPVLLELGESPIAMSLSLCRAVPAWATRRTYRSW